jgi:hypothetical protein
MARLKVPQAGKLAQRIRLKHEKLRRRFPEIRGKKVDWVTYHVDDGTLYVDIQFQDGTEFYLTFEPQITTHNAVLWDPRKSDDEVIRSYKVKGRI